MRLGPRLPRDDRLAPGGQSVQRAPEGVSLVSEVGNQNLMSQSRLKGCGRKNGRDESRQEEIDERKRTGAAGSNQVTGGERGGEEGGDEECVVCGLC